ncbi:MAG TPA: YihY/virulence factor BrkB family protein [Bacteroidia bacterium]|nr:YihY/virulence factor BrkB family protein [Bacteroidia bacterium]
MTTLKEKAFSQWSIIKKTALAWNAADPFREAAIISYYAIFSIPALLVIIIAAAGLVFGKEAVSGHISAQISAAIGVEAAKQVEQIVARASETKSSVLASIIGVITLITGATGVFAQLQKSLNLIWEVEAQPKKAWLKTLKDRLFSFGLILSIGFLLLVSLLISTALSALSDWIKIHLPDFMMFLFRFLSFVVSFAVISILFMLMFKILPDVKIKWKNVWIGAVITTLLFIAGKFALGLYFGKSDPGSTYGAAGSVILIMLWVNYSSMIVFFGAEYTKQYSMHQGGKIRPKKDAVILNVTEKEKIVKDKNMAVKDN